MIYTACIVDDEPLARKRINNLLKEYQSIKIVGESGEVLESVEIVNEQRPDLLFLDIQLKAKKGFKILELIDYLPVVIFTTAYSEYAVKAFEYYAIDYLLKPFNDERFHRSLTRALDIIRNKKKPWHGNIQDFLENIGAEAEKTFTKTLIRIPVRIADRTHFVETTQIMYIKASAYYAELYAEDGKHIIRESLSNLIEQLDSNVFVRIHRSSIVNINYIQEVVSIGFGDIEIKMKNGELVRVSKSYKKDLVKKLGLK